MSFFRVLVFIVVNIVCGFGFVLGLGLVGFDIFIEVILRSLCVR